MPIRVNNPAPPFAQSDVVGLGDGSPLNNQASSVDAGGGNSITGDGLEAATLNGDSNQTCLVEGPLDLNNNEIDNVGTLNASYVNVASGGQLDLQGAPLAHVGTVSDPDGNTTLYLANGQVGFGESPTSSSGAPLQTFGDVAVQAQFGGAIPIYLIANQPNLGFNSFFNGFWQYGAGSSSNYAGRVDLDSLYTGAMHFSITAAPGEEGDFADLDDNTLLAIAPDGTVSVLVGPLQSPSVIVSNPGGLSDQSGATFTNNSDALSHGLNVGDVYTQTGTGQRFQVI